MSHLNPPAPWRHGITTHNAALTIRLLLIMSNPFTCFACRRSFKSEGGMQRHQRACAPYAEYERDILQRARASRNAQGPTPRRRRLRGAPGTDASVGQPSAVHIGVAGDASVPTVPSVPRPITFETPHCVEYAGLEPARPPSTFCTTAVPLIRANHGLPPAQGRAIPQLRPSPQPVPVPETSALNHSSPQTPEHDSASSAIPLVDPEDNV
ncbi:hypothetical protein BKA93DRAFT_829008 [Sparassis latifolia]